MVLYIVLSKNAMIVSMLTLDFEIGKTDFVLLKTTPTWDEWV